MIKESRIITRLHDKKWIIEIEENRDGFNAWLYHKQYLDKMFIFGCQRNQPDCIYYKDKGGKMTVDDFIDIVTDPENLINDKRDYADRFMDSPDEWRD